VSQNFSVGPPQALAWLLGAPGASRTVLDARVPYAPAALAEALGGPPPAAYASAATAAAMARAALRQAAQLAALGEPLVGLGIACALATDRPKKGKHKVRRGARVWSAAWCTGPVGRMPGSCSFNRGCTPCDAHVWQRSASAGLQRARRAPRAGRGPPLSMLAAAGCGRPRA